MLAAADRGMISLSAQVIFRAIAALGETLSVVSSFQAVMVLAPNYCTEGGHTCRLEKRPEVIKPRGF